MTRTEIAAFALQGILAAHTGDGPLPEPKEAAKKAVAFADAIMNRTQCDWARLVNAVDYALVILHRNGIAAQLGQTHTQDDIDAIKAAYKAATNEEWKTP